MTEQPTVTVLVSRGLLKHLGEWSPPVQVRITETPGVGTGWEMTARTVAVTEVASRDDA
jgi:hypothetical protein